MNKETSFAVYSPAALLRVTGGDARVFLQGQFTNDLQGSVLGATYGLWLNQKGRVLADSHILQLSGNEFLVASIASPAATIRQRLEQYIIADEVELADETEIFRGLALWGHGCGERMKAIFGEKPEPQKFCRTAEAWGFAGRRMEGENYEILGSTQKISALRQRLSELVGREADASEMEFARISEGIPAVPQDIGLGDLPQEGGLEHTAISYTKGCYLGQEVMARLKNMGKVRRRLQVVGGSGAPPKPNEAVFQNGKRVGEFRSATGRGDEFVALAMITLLNLNAEAGLSRGVDEPATIRIIPRG